MLEKTKNGIENTIKHLETEFSKLQLGRASPSMIEDIMVEQYGTMQFIKNTSSINILDNQTISINPWDKTMLGAITKAINDSGMGLNPQTMADSIIIKIPVLTGERREHIKKMVKKLSEEAKVGVRNARADSHKSISKAKDNKSISEDEARDLNEDLQKIVDNGNKKIDDMSKRKEEDVMKV